MNISGHTRLAAVIGHPVRHSLSPAIHNAAFAALALDWRYVAFDVAPGDASTALDAVRTLGIGGLSVTMPHKFAVADAVDECSPAATALGAVNCVVNNAGTLIGHNTDGAGFLGGLAHDAGFDPTDTRCLVVGAGGAARAVIHALGAAGAAEVAVKNRSADRAGDAARLAGTVGTVFDGDHRRFDLLVNATPLGMTGVGDDQGMPTPVAAIEAHQVVVDLVYEPAETPWLAAADGRAQSAHNGLSMLVFQAAHAFEVWTGHDAPVEAMYAAATAQLGRPGGDRA